MQSSGDHGRGAVQNRVRAVIISASDGEGDSDSGRLNAQCELARPDGKAKWSSCIRRRTGAVTTSARDGHPGLPLVVRLFPDGI